MEWRIALHLCTETRNTIWQWWLRGKWRHQWINFDRRVVTRVTAASWSARTDWLMMMLHYWNWMRLVIAHWDDRRRRLLMTDRVISSGTGEWSASVVVTWHHWRLLLLSQPLLLLGEIVRILHPRWQAADKAFNLRHGWAIALRIWHGRHRWNIYN